MPLSDKGSRKLPYPLNRTFEPIGDTPDEPVLYDVIAGFPDETTRVNVTLNLSLDEYIALATAVDVGRDIAFADDSELIWFTWVRAFREGSVMACEEVADCVESEIAEGNTTLINALTQNTIATGSGGNYNRVNGDITTVLDRNPPLSLQESINPEFECDLNKLWGAIRHGIVERLDDTARDLLEDLAAINDLPQRFQAFIDVIPVLGDIAEGIVTLATEVVPDILNLYNSFSSEAALDEIACDLFSLVCAECRMPTFEELYNYYSTLGYELDAMDAQTLAPMMQKIAGMIGAFQPASIVYHSMITFQLFTLYLQAEFNGVAGVSTIYKWGRLGEDFGSDNWVDLCETCGELYMIWTWDFVTQGQGEWYVDSAITSVTNKPVFVNGKGWMLVNHGTGKRADIAMPLDPAWQFRAVGFNTSGATLTGRQIALRPNAGSTSGQAILSISGGTGDYNHVANGLLSTDSKNEVAVFGQTGNTTDVCYIDRVAVIFNTGFAKSPATPTSDITL